MKKNKRHLAPKTSSATSHVMVFRNESMMEVLIFPSATDEDILRTVYNHCIDFGLCEQDAQEAAEYAVKLRANALKNCDDAYRLPLTVFLTSESLEELEKKNIHPYKQFTRGKNK